MKNYKNITDLFYQRYRPTKALVIYTPDQAGSPSYVESYDMDDEGTPINAHPLTVKECEKLRKALETSSPSEKVEFLSPKGLLPDQVLHVNPSKGSVVWYTHSQIKTLRFTKNLDIPNGQAYVPPMIWKATRDTLWMWAYTPKKQKRPTLEEPLFTAPFFNIYKNGSVCMGTVGSFENREGYLEDFIAFWQEAFWNSAFSHLNFNTSPVTGNIVQLWQELIKTNRPFPMDSLIATGKTLHNIIQS